MSGAMISAGLKAVKGSEVYKGIDKMFVLNCPVYELPQSSELV